MIGLVIVAHGELAEALKSATEHVVGPMSNARAISIAPNDDLDARQRDVDAAVAELDVGDGVVLVTDMFGGSPSNLAMRAQNGRRTEVIYGVNLPVLIKLAKCAAKHKPLQETVDCALEAGKKYFSCASLRARRREANGDAPAQSDQSAA